MSTLAGSVARLLHVSVESGWAVLTLDTEAGVETVVGCLAHLRPGESVVLDGDYSTHPRFGHQFKAESVEVVALATNRGIERFLQSVQGVGPATARAIVERFGERTLEIAEREPARLTEVFLVNAARADAIAAEVRGRIAEVRIVAKLRGWAVPERFVSRILRKYGTSACELIEENPYRLIDDFEGVGFVTADAIARASGVPHASPFRVRAGVLHVLAEATGEGHCYLPVVNLVRDSARLLGLKGDAVRAELAEMESAGRLVLDGEAAYLRRLWEVECSVAAKLRAMVETPRAGELVDDEAGDDDDPGRQIAVPADDSDLSRLAGVDLTDRQAEAIRAACAEPLVVITGGPGVGKGLALDTPIPTVRGFVLMGDLVAGDVVFDDAGRPCHVTFVSDEHRRPCFEVVLDDGTSIVADDEHLWNTWTRAARRSAARRRNHALKDRGSDQLHKRSLPGTVSTLEIARSLYRNDGGLNHSIAVAKPLLYGLAEISDFSIHPYLLGVWLGNGHTDGASVTDGDDWIRREVERCGHRTSDRKTRTGIHSYGIFRGDGGSLLPAMRALSLIGNKHIPGIYLRASIDDRLALLQGLMDTDGTCGKNGRCEFSVTVRRLADDFHALACGMGIKTFRDDRPAMLRSKRCGTAYRVSFTTLLPVFRYPRKASRLPKKVRATQSQRYIVSVTATDTVPTRCIEVDSPSHLYLATAACVPTHNTLVTRTIVALANASRATVRLCAPTGRAAKRLSEVTGASAATIHRLLEYHPERGWRRNQVCPIDSDLVICDEVSMVDLQLLGRLLDALPRGCRLVLVGDADQLPSVGPGRVLRDVIESGVCRVVALDRVFRQGAASRIAVNAHRVNRGEPLELPARGEESDFYTAFVLDPDALRREVVRMATEAIPARLGVDFLRDILILSPMYKGAVGVDALNEALQAAVNPNGEHFGGNKRGLRAGDRVIETRNQYDLNVFNGDLGMVRAVGVGEGAKGIEIEVDGRLVEYSPEQARTLRLGYALTVHKAQGGEMPVVLLVCHKSHFIMLQRTLLYTGMTRAQRLLVLCGTREAVEIATSRTESRQRWTGLVARLREAQ